MNAWLRTQALPPAITLAAVLAAWQLAVSLLDTPPLILPSPVRIAQEAWHNLPTLVAASGQTAAAAACALTIALVLGTLIAMLFSQSPLIRLSFFPYAIFLQTVPIVAIAPVIVVWLDEGFAAVVVIATVISLFPPITNGTAGMISVPLPLQELFQLNRASRWQTLWKLQLPHAMPQLVTGARIASGLSVLGALVGEMFAGVGVDRPGLGYTIFVANDRFNMAFLFAAIAVSTLLGVAMFSLVSIIGEQGLLYWRERRMYEE
jgi:NitT/TauT family transport system permease protein